MTDANLSARPSRVFLCALATCAGLTVACSTGDISGEPAFATMIGQEYRIIGDVDAYGIREDDLNKEAAYITLIPPPGISGTEVVFTKRLSKGETFRIRGARRKFFLFDNGARYIIELQDSDLPQGVEVIVPLFRGNESGHADLNPRLYERVR